MTKIAVLVGSLREQSYNKRLAKALEKLAPDDVEFDYVDLNLPLYNQDFDGNYPTEAVKLKRQIEAADGVLFVTPEYNRGIPGVLKNAIDLGSRPWGTNSFAGKPVGVVGASSGSVGTAVAQSNLHHIAGFLGAKLMGQPELYLANSADKFNDDGSLVDDSKVRAQRYITAFTTWVNREKIVD